MLTGDFTHDPNGVAEVECDPAASAVQCESSAASGRRIRPDVVVVDAHIHRAAALRTSGQSGNNGESEKQRRESQCFP